MNHPESPNVPTARQRAEPRSCPESGGRPPHSIVTAPQPHAPYPAGQNWKTSPSVTQNETTVTPPQHKALQLLEAHPRLFARQGSVVATWRKYGERKLGPYWRLVYRVDGRQRTVYLGRFGTLVRQVRARLRRLQAYRDMRRTIARSVRLTKASLRTTKTDLARRLRRWGLRLKGWEVRGWRTSPIRWALNLTRPMRNVPLGPQPGFPTIALPNLPEIFATGRIPDSTYRDILRKGTRKSGRRPK